MNRFKFKESDVQKVIKHLQSGPSPLSVREDEKQAVVPPGKITANDILTRPRDKHRKGMPKTEPIPWVARNAGAELAGSWQRASLKAGPKNKSVLYAKEDDTWKLVVPHEEIEVLAPEHARPREHDAFK